MTTTHSNPYKPGSFAHQQHATYITWYADEPADTLTIKYQALRKEANNYLRHSSQTMYNMDTQADAIALIYREKFGTEIEEGAL